LQQYLQAFFGGSLRPIMVSLVGDASRADDKLDALRNEIRRAKGRKTGTARNQELVTVA